MPVFSYGIISVKILHWIFTTFKKVSLQFQQPHSTSNITFFFKNHITFFHLIQVNYRIVNNFTLLMISHFLFFIILTTDNVSLKEMFHYNSNNPTALVTLTFSSKILLHFFTRYKSTNRMVNNFTLLKISHFYFFLIFFEMYVISFDPWKSTFWQFLSA